MSINKKRDIIGLVLGIVILLLINHLSSLAFQRFDLTSENRYSISEPTKELLESIEDEVYLRVYLEGEFPADFKRLRNETREMLNEFKAYSNGNLDFKFINPSEATELKVRDEVYRNLYKKGLRPTDLEVKEEDGISQKIIWPGALIAVRDIEFPVQLLKGSLTSNSEVMVNQSIESLEYELANGIKNAVKTNTKSIAITEGHGEYDKYELADLTGSLRERYNVERVKFNGNLDAFTERFFNNNDSTRALVRNKYDAVIIARPDSAFSEKDKFILDQFVMRGGKIIWAIDQVSASMDSLRGRDVSMAIPKDLNLNDLFFKYGVRINHDLLMDLQAAPIPLVQGTIGNRPQTKLFPWYFFPLMIPQGDHPISKNLNAIRGEFVSSIDLVGNDSLKKSVFLTSSEYTKVVKAPTRISLNILRYEPPKEQYNVKNVPVAVVVEGEFKSVYQNRLTEQFTRSGLIDFKEKSENNKMIFLSDANILKNETNKSTNEYYAMGYDKYARQVFANKDFILNACDYLLDESELILSNNKTLKIRLLDLKEINESKLIWQVINLIAPILLIIILGFIIHLLRRRYYIN